MTRLNVRDFGTALSFDGINDVVTVSNVSGSVVTMWVQYKDGWKFVVNNNETYYTNAVQAVPDFFPAYLDGSDLVIGKSDGATFHKCRVDDVRTFTSLTTEDIYNIYHVGLIRGSAESLSLSGEWLFNEGSGSTAYDTSGNGNHGTITGATYTTDVPMVARSSAGVRVSTQPVLGTMKFNGASTLIDVGVDFLGTEDMSACAWLYAGSLGEGGGGRVFSNGRMTLNCGSANKLRFSSDNSTNLDTPNGSLPLRGWFHVAVTRSARSSDGPAEIYINGSLVASGSSGTPTAATTNLILGNTSTAAGTWNGMQFRHRYFNRILTPSEILSLYKEDKIPDTTSLLAKYDLDPLTTTTTTAYDTSGNGRNGTITAAVTTQFDPNVPFNERSLINGNLIRNGDFKYTPPFTAAATTTARWLDGTAGGSTTNGTFNVGVTLNASSASVQFDTTTTHNGLPSVKLSNLNATGRAQANIGALATGASLTLAALAGAAKIQPSTEYQLSYWVKTENAATNSVFLARHLHSGIGTRTSSTDSSNKFSGTNDWTYVRETFTSGSSDYYAIFPILNNVAGNVSDAWFADIQLKPTTP